MQSVSCHICVYYLSDAVHQASGPLLVEIVKGPSTTLGISLTTTIYRGKQVVIIDKIKPASVVERSDRLLKKSVNSPQTENVLTR